MKIDRQRQGTLGYSTATAWRPTDLHYYARQQATQRGAWAADDAGLREAVQSVVTAFREEGTRAGLREATRRGLREGAILYWQARAETEEQLAARAARMKALAARRPLDRRLAIELAFVQARLDEVRAAVKDGHTPPQAVVDRPEVPRREVPRWVPFTALAVGLLALATSFGRGRARRETS